MINEHIVNILKVGLSGFAFLLMVLTYYLLSKEQKREKPNEKILVSIRQFGWLTIVFLIIVGGFSLAEIVFKPTQSNNSQACKESIERLRTLSQSPE